MIDREEAEQILEAQDHLFLGAGEDVGPVLRIYLDGYTGWPSFCTIAVLGSNRPDGSDNREALVALHEAELRPAGGVAVPYDRARVEQAPTVGVDQDLTIAEEDALFDYYEVPIEGAVPQVAHLGSALVIQESADDTSGPDAVERGLDRQS